MNLAPLRTAMTIVMAISSVLATPRANSAAPQTPTERINQPGGEPAPAPARSDGATVADSSVRTGVWTYAGRGTVNTHWIETPGGGLVVIDTQRDLVHASQAIDAVRAVGKPVRAILITHAHPDHYTGIGLFKKAFPQATVYASAATFAAIRDDAYGYNTGTQKDAPDVTPQVFLTPDKAFVDNAILQIDGLTIVTRELGAGEAHDTTAYYLPDSGDLYLGDAILNHLHAPLLEATTAAWLGILDRLDVLYPDVRIVHPGMAPRDRSNRCSTTSAPICAHAVLLSPRRSHAPASRRQPRARQYGESMHDSTMSIRRESPTLSAPASTACSKSFHRHWACRFDEIVSGLRQRDAPGLPQVVVEGRAD
jgi:glyoxylase-like metal-dependent hydrolase (beta-lactamase superfamily II)